MQKGGMLSAFVHSVRSITGGGRTNVDMIPRGGGTLPILTGFNSVSAECLMNIDL